MMPSSNGIIFRVTGPLSGEFPDTGEFPAQRPVTRSFDVFFDLRLNKRLSKHPRRRWFETLSRSLWRYCNVLNTFCLTHWVRNNMVVILQTIFSNSCLNIQFSYFGFNFHWNLFPRVESTIKQHWFSKWLSAEQVISNYLIQFWPIYIVAFRDFLHYGVLYWLRTELNVETCVGVDHKMFQIWYVSLHITAWYLL